MRRVLNNYESAVVAEGKKPRASSLRRLSFSSPSRRTQAGIPRERCFIQGHRGPLPGQKRAAAAAAVAAAALPPAV